MKNGKRMAPPRCAWLLAMLAVAVLCPAYANVVSVDANTLSGSLSTGQAGSARIQWVVESDVGLGTTVQSGSAEIRANSPGGTVIGQVNTGLQGTTDTSTVNGATATLTETVTLPQQALLRAQSLGADRLFIVRSFDDGGASASDASGVAISGGLGGEFRLVRIALRFDDGAVQRVVSTDSTLSATASITFTGSGRIEGRWEIAQPTSTLGEPRFRSLGVVRRQVTGASREVSLESPSLPTGTQGIYLLRLRITSPETGFEPPELGYAVNAGEAVEANEIGGLGPPKGTTWESGTLFRWSEMDRAAAYRVEFHARRDAGEDAPPVSGVLVPAPASVAQLSRVARSHLEEATPYWWRVLAFDDEGNIIGRSPLTLLRMPPASE
jgi:hypothetical protein